MKMRVLFLVIALAVFVMPAAAQITVAPDTTSNLTYSKDTGTSTCANNLRGLVDWNRL